MLQTHDTTVSGLKRFSILAIHGTKTDMNHRGFRFYISSLLRYTEDLLKVKLLTFVCNINVFYWLEVLLTLQDSSQVRGCIQSSSVRLADDTRRQLLGVDRFGYVYNQSALALVCQAFVLQILDQPRNILFRIALAFPEFEMNIQVVVVSL